MKLKLKLIVLAMILPISSCLLGVIIAQNSYLIGFTFNSHTITMLFGIGGFALGLAFDIVCYYRKLFAIAIYQTPIPLTLFFLFWWISNSFVNSGIALIIGLGGLSLGLWLNSILVLPYQFFKIKKRILALLYLFYSIVILGLFMGIPIVNLLLGIFAGNYIAIRIISYIKDENGQMQNIKQGALFSAFVIFIISAIAVFLAYSDIDSYLAVFKQITHIELNTDRFLYFMLSTGFIAVILQFYLTKFTAETMLELHSFKKNN